MIHVRSIGFPGGGGGGGGGGTLMYGLYIGTCRGIGYGFLGSRSLNRVSFLTLLFLCGIGLHNYMLFIVLDVSLKMCMLLYAYDRRD